MEPAHFALLGMIFGAYLAGSALGFGSSMLVVTFGAQLFPLDLLLPVVVPLNIALSSYLAVRYRRETAWRVLGRRMIPLVGAGVPVGLLLFNLGEMKALKLAFGLFVIVLAAAQLRLSWAKTSGPALSRGFGGGMLFGGGVVHGLFGTGGPLIVYVVGREIGDKGSFRSTLAAMWIPMNTALLINYLLVGLYDVEVARLAALSIVPVLGATFLGELAHARLDAHRFQTAVWGLLLVGGLILSIRAGLSLA